MNLNKKLSDLKNDNASLAGLAGLQDADFCSIVARVGSKDQNSKTRYPFQKTRKRSLANILSNIR